MLYAFIMTLKTEICLILSLLAQLFIILITINDFANILMSIMISPKICHCYIC